MFALLCIAALAGLAVSSDTCVITPDGSNGGCASEVSQLKILGYDDGADGACTTEGTPVAIPSATLLAYAPLVESAASVLICGVSFQDTDLNYTVATYLPNLAAIQGDITVKYNENMAEFVLPATASIGGTFEFTGNTDAGLVSLPALTSLNASVHIELNAQLATFEASMLPAIPGHLLVRDNTELVSIKLDSLDALGMAGTDPFVNDGLSYSLYIRRNYNLSSLCTVDPDPDSVAAGVFVCENADTPAGSMLAVQIRDSLSHISNTRTLCAVSLPGDATCPCAQASSDPKQCKGGGPPRPPLGFGAVNTGQVLAFAAVAFAAGSLMYMRRRRMQILQGRLRGVHVLATPTEAMPLLISPAHEPVPPPYAMGAYDSTKEVPDVESAGATANAPPVYQQ